MAVELQGRQAMPTACGKPNAPGTPQTHGAPAECATACCSNQLACSTHLRLLRGQNVPHPNRVALGQARHEQDCALGADVKGAIAVLAVVHPKQVVEESLQWVGQGARKGRAGAYQGRTQASSQRAAEGQYASLGNAGMHRCGAVVAPRRAGVGTPLGGREARCCYCH